MHMQDDFPLLLSTLYDHGVRHHPDQLIVSVESDGSTARVTYADTDVRLRRLATALRTRLGVEPGEAVGTFGWNNRRHHELYWATVNSGLICHTLNVRLFVDQLVYIIDHAGDKVLFVDPDLIPVIEPVLARVESVERVVVNGDSTCGLRGAVAYEELIDGVEPHPAWPELDERSPLMLCYTSGTTGNPKGVAFTQRSTYLHALSNLANLPLSAEDNVLVLVPMFHASAWGYPFEAVPVGARLTYPGRDLGPEAIAGLIAAEQVTFSAGVPTVWLGVRQYLTDHPDTDTSSVRAILSGGAAVPRSLIEWFHHERGIDVIQAWGMTETNPVASTVSLPPAMRDRPFEERLDLLGTAGRIIPGLRYKIIDEAGEELPHDGEAFGELLIRGPWIAAEYYRDERSAVSFEDGWLRTGDVCRITPDGFIQVTDRAKDLIKSGGEWISSLDLENAVMAHPEVAEAAVVGLEHPIWQERPVALVVARPEASLDEDAVLEWLRPRVAAWWLPDRVLFVEEIPRTGTGKFDKKVVRQRHAGLLR